METIFAREHNDPSSYIPRTFVILPCRSYSLLPPAMKFGTKISVCRIFISVFPFLTNKPSQTDLYDEWRPFYLDYNYLKRELKACSL